jgi:hypothetical protein
MLAAETYMKKIATEAYMKYIATEAYMKNIALQQIGLPYIRRALYSEVISLNKKSLLRLTYPGRKWYPKHVPS